jgi:hypothetical protein
MFRWQEEIGSACPVHVRLRSCPNSRRQKRSKQTMREGRMQGCEMKSLKMLVVLLLAGSMFIGQPKSERQVILPSSGLMKCGATQLWVNETVPGESVYPVRLIVDHFDQNGCPQGIIALYDKTISENEIRASLDKLYGKWARPDSTALPVKLWRVEPERFAIQLTTVIDSLKETGSLGAKGMKQVIYLSFSLSKQESARQSR